MLIEFLSHEGAKIVDGLKGVGCKTDFNICVLQRKTRCNGIHNYKLYW